MEVARELPEDRPELARLSERLDRLEEPAESAFRLEQALDVGDVTADLDRELEVTGGPFGPAANRRFGGQPVEGVVDLDRVEDLGVALEPAPLGQPFGVENAPPIAVVPARAADVDGLAQRGG